MSEILKECVLDSKCSYLENFKQKTHYKIIENCTTEECDNMIERGWRRFGQMFFRPICQECSSCESFKIDVDNFTFTKSQRRVIKKNEDLQLIIRQPSLTQNHLDIFKKYHEFKQNMRGWDKQNVTPNNYYSSFVQGFEDFGHEILYFEDEKLIAVDLIDILPNGISSIYFYHDPDSKKRSLGHYSLYRQILLAKQKGLKWIYLGYYVEGCQSLEYKKDYKPYLTLQGRPHEEDSDVWL
ncbi:MAG: arginyltransferase [Helicobacteraceae bacterium]|nr:arginyltransferase [Helicobacteraceae bacterium]